jgi:thiamine kinase-like enzyme
VQNDASSGVVRVKEVRGGTKLQTPIELNEINRDWLTHALDAPVKAVRLVDAHSGTTGRAMLQIDYVEAVQLPRRIFVKLPPTDEGQRAFVCSTGMGLREVLFYQQLAAEVPLRVPHCYYAASDDSGEQYIMLLEDLEDSGCTFHNASSRYSLEYTRQVLSSFARLHAHYWESPRFNGDLAWVAPPVQHDIAKTLVSRALQIHGDDMPPVFTAMAELYLLHADAIHRLWEQGPATLIHGDVHDGNLFFDGGPGFLDWALVARGPAMRDVGYFLAGTLSPEDQRAHNKELMSYYRKQLLANGAPAPAAEELWRQYQWHAAYVWVGATATLAMGDDWQSTAYVLKTLERLHQALAELGTVSAIHAALNQNE